MELTRAAVEVVQAPSGRTQAEVEHTSWAVAASLQASKAPHPGEGEGGGPFAAVLQEDVNRLECLDFLASHSWNRAVRAQAWRCARRCRSCLARGWELRRLKTRAERQACSCSAHETEQHHHHWPTEGRQACSCLARELESLRPQEQQASLVDDDPRCAPPTLVVYVPLPPCVAGGLLVSSQAPRASLRALLHVADGQAQLE